MLPNILTLFLTGFLILFSIMSIIWLVQLKTKNAGMVDVAWAFSFPVLAILYNLCAEGYELRKNLISVLVIIWGARLGIYLFLRNYKGPEDSRYAQLRKEWGEKANMKMFLFFQFQAILAVLLSLPFLLIMLNPNPAISALEITGTGLWIIGFAGESMADEQLKKFKSRAQNKGKICEKGLWYYSRHPNYFFEWVIWLAYLVIALASPFGWLSIISPLLMLHFLKNVTGVPATEEQILKSKGDQYRRYQKTTSAFFPWFKKSLNSN